MRLKQKELAQRCAARLREQRIPFRREDLDSILVSPDLKAFPGLPDHCPVPRLIIPINYKDPLINKLQTVKKPKKKLKR
jgi:hypothetical protein